MTREEHISNLETIGCDGWTVTTEAYKSLQFAIKELEQEPILDKIRAEILSRDEKVRAIRSDKQCFFTADEIIEIIDKYKAESEEP